MDVIKIGGSLITYKNGYCSPNLSKIQEYAKVIKTISRDNNFIIVLGGGSFGNAVPFKYNIRNKYSSNIIDIAEMTTKMFEWVTIFSNNLRENNIPAYPFQASSLILSTKNAIESTYFEVLSEVTEHGMIPVISGDLVFGRQNNDFHIFSSDYIPLALRRKFSIERFISLTDVDGLKKSLDDEGIIEEINDKNYKNLYNFAEKSNSQDFTGGMETKIKSLLNLAHNNIDCFIVNGKEPENLLNFYENKSIQYTYIKKGDYSDYSDLWN